ncbi:hypothetical protein C0991_006102 [Blastosporella zonata]|nr:hypothetical protein C0991_006102 [Blastosporella zonata]
MPKAPAFVPKPAIEKLGLAIRKDIRDKYESEKDELEAAIGKLLGVSFHVEINANEVLAYNPENSNSSVGAMLKRYVEGFISALKWYLDKFGDEGKVHFNDAVTKSELTVNVNELGDKGDTISADVKDGVFRILFHQDKLGYNQNNLNEFLLKAIESVPRAGFSIVAKTSIEEHFKSEIDEVQAEIGEILAMRDVVLDPNFEENYAALSVKPDQKWHVNFGLVTLAYFKNGLKSQLINQKFKGDDMLQEGLAELLSSKTFKVRVVKTTKTTIETVLENGVVYFQVSLTKWRARYLVRLIYLPL